jgi:hypothetical protein
LRITKTNKDVNKQNVESTIETMKQELTAFVEQEGNITSSNEYEDQGYELGRQFSKGVIEEKQGKVPKSRNSKKNYNII